MADLDLSGFDEEMESAPKAKAKELDLSVFDEPEQDSDLSDAYDTVKSIGQGATLGFGDDIVGALQGSADFLTDPKAKSWLESYRKRQKDAESEYDAVKERSPVLSTAGEIAGGIAVPGMGLMGATKGMGLVGKALFSTGMGAAAGAGGSRGTLEKNPEQVLKDVGIGGAFGAVAELGLAGLGKAGKGISEKFGPGIKEYVGDSPKLRQILTSFDEGKEGKSFTGNKNRERLQKELEENSSKLANDLDKMKKYGQEKYSSVLESAEPITNVDAEDLLPLTEAADVLENLGNSGGARIKESLATLTKLKNGEPVDAQSVKELQKILRDNSFKINQGVTSDELTAGAAAANRILKTNVKGYTGVNDLHGQIQDPISSFVKNVPAEEMSVASRPKGATIDTTTFKSAEDVLKKSELPYGMGDKQANQLRLLKDGLKNLEQTDPNALKQMGIDNIDDYFKNIQKQSDVQAIGRGIEKSGEMNKNILDTFSPDLNTAYKGANIAGNAVGVTKNLGQSLYKMPEKALGGVAESLLSNPETKHLGTALQQTLQNPGTASKNAILFSIMQNPAARKQIEGVVPSDEAEK